MKIWYKSTLDFKQHPHYERALGRHLRTIASSDTEVVVEGRDSGFGKDLNVVGFAGSPIMYHSVVAPAFVRSLLVAEDAGADAFITGSFSEPILPELRSLASIPVISMSEACYSAAAMSAPKIGFVTLNAMVIPFIEKSAALHKWKERISGVHLLEGNVDEGELDANFDSPAPYIDRLVVGIRQAIAAGAQVVIPAEGVLAMMAAENDVREVDGVPVIDSIGTSLLSAENAVKLKTRTGLAQSRAAYPAPDGAAKQLLRGAYLPDQRAEH